MIFDHVNYEKTKKPSDGKEFGFQDKLYQAIMIK
jgi:hypothetical protein